MNKPVLVVMAAGMGSRYGGMKQIDPVGPKGQPIVEYSLYDAHRAGFTIPEGRVKPWGTCHAVLAAKDLIDGPFAVINADDYYGPEAFKVIYEYLSTHQDGAVYDYCMVSYLLKNKIGRAHV